MPGTVHWVPTERHERGRSETRQLEGIY